MGEENIARGPLAPRVYNDYFNFLDVHSLLSCKYPVKETDQYM